MGIFKDVIDLILPLNCCICGKFADATDKISYDVPDNFHICFDCLSKIVPSPTNKRFFPCLSEPYKGDPHPDLGLYVLFPYEGIWKQAISKIKFGSCYELAQFAGQILGSYMLKDNIGADLIIPIPLSSKRFKERGYNQAFVIANEASKILGIPCVENVLSRCKETKRQADVDDNSKRALNVEGAFKASDEFDFGGLTVVLIDDVATTGNTLHEAACELYKAGASKIKCVTLCGNRAVLNTELF